MRKKKIAIVFLLLCIGATGFLMWQIRPQQDQTGGILQVENVLKKPQKQSLSVFMAGDALLHGAVYTDAEVRKGQYDFTEMMSTLDMVKDYDLAYYNQETILGGVELGLSTYPRFNSPQEFGDTMMDLGFNLVSLANNHTLDKNEEGVRASLEYWANQDAITAGSYGSWDERNAVQVYEKNGITYGFLAYTYGTNGLIAPKGKEYLVNVYTEQMILEDISAVREQVDFLLVSMHWGVEYTHKPNAEQEHYAKLLADAGVDLIIGMHPHVIQPVTYIDDTLCFYSLGNLISAQTGEMKRIGMIASANLEKVTFGNQVFKKVSDPRADLVYTYYDEPSIKNFKLYQFDELNDDLLKNHEEIYREYCEIVQRMDASVQIGLK